MIAQQETLWQWERISHYVYTATYIDHKSLKILLMAWFIKALFWMRYKLYTTILLRTILRI